MHSLNRGQLFVVSAPSGVGKSTIIRRVLEDHPDLRYSVSSTTRAPREGEIHGKDYNFLTREAFLAGIQARRFIEWAEVHGHYYGTDAEQLNLWLTAGDDVLLEIDVQGAALVRCVYPSAWTIFILPPSMEVLAERLKGRKTETPEQITLRLAAAENEIKKAPWYDFVVVNDTLDEAVADFKAIIRACKCVPGAQPERLRAFLLPKEPTG